MSTPNNPLLGQADTVLASLERQPELSPALRIEIEEAVEAAWEIAFRRPSTHNGPVRLSLVCTSPARRQ